MEVRLQSTGVRIPEIALGDLRQFSEWIAGHLRTKGLDAAWRYRASRELRGMGYGAVYLDSRVVAESAGIVFRPDLLGVRKKNLALAFLVADSATRVPPQLSLLEEAENVRTFIMTNLTPVSSSFLSKYQEAFDAGKFRLVNLFDSFEDLKQAFGDVFDLMETFYSTTRIRMLLSLLDRPRDIGDFREKINPKLIYENLPLLRNSGLVEETEEGAFAMTETGRKMVEEFLRFLARLNETMERGEED